MDYKKLIAYSAFTVLTAGCDQVDNMVAPRTSIEVPDITISDDTRITGCVVTRELVGDTYEITNQLFDELLEDSEKYNGERGWIIGDVESVDFAEQTATIKVGFIQEVVCEFANRMTQRELEALVGTEQGIGGIIKEHFLFTVTMEECQLLDL